MSQEEKSKEIMTSMWTIEVNYPCGKCGEMMKSIDRPGFYHKCTKCDNIEQLEKQYPHIIHVPFEGPIPDLMGMQYFMGVIMNFFDTRYMLKPPSNRQDLNSLLSLFSMGNQPLTETSENGGTENGKE